MNSQDSISETSFAKSNWQKIENDVKAKLIKFLQSDEESISLDINNIIEYAFYLYYLKKLAFTSGPQMTTRD